MNARKSIEHHLTITLFFLFSNKQSFLEMQQIEKPLNHERYCCRSQSVTAMQHSDSNNCGTSCCVIVTYTASPNNQSWPCAVHNKGQVGNSCAVFRCPKHQLALNPRHIHYSAWLSAHQMAWPLLSEMNVNNSSPSAKHINIHMLVHSI